MGGGTRNPRRPLELGLAINGKTGMKKRKTRLRVVEKKLGRECVHGQFTPGENPLIEIDPRQRSRQYLNTLCHEILHFSLPRLPESMVMKVACALTRRIWEAGYRRMMR